MSDNGRDLPNPLTLEERHVGFLFATNKQWPALTGKNQVAKFKKGQSGNPKGRPIGSSYVDVCKEWAESEGWEQLIAWARGQEKATAPMRIEAAKTLLSYGYGKPRQAVEHLGPGGAGEIKWVINIVPPDEASDE